MIRMKFWAFWYIVCLCLENVVPETRETWEPETGGMARKMRWLSVKCGTHKGVVWQPSKGYRRNSIQKQGWKGNLAWKKKPIKGDGFSLSSLHFSPSSSCCFSPSPPQVSATIGGKSNLHKLRFIRRKFIPIVALLLGTWELQLDTLQAR